MTEEDQESGQHQTTAAMKAKSKSKRQRYKNKKKKSGSNGKTGNHTKFIGSEVGMRNNVFQCREESKSSLQFNKTCKEMIHFVSSTYSQHEDIVYLIEKLDEPVLHEPPSPKAMLVKDESDPKRMIQLDPTWKEKHMFSK